MTKDELITKILEYIDLDGDEYSDGELLDMIYELREFYEKEK